MYIIIIVEKHFSPYGKIRQRLHSPIQKKAEEQHVVVLWLLRVQGHDRSTDLILALFFMPDSFPDESLPFYLGTQG